MIQEFKKDVKQNIPKHIIQFKVQLHNIKKGYIRFRFNTKDLVITFSFIYQKLHISRQMKLSSRRLL